MPKLLDAPESKSDGRSAVTFDTLQPPTISPETSLAKARTLGTLLRAVVSVGTGSRERHVLQRPYPLQPPEMFLDHLSRTDPYF